MPSSVGRHNLARIRKYLKLTQADVAGLADCSPASIKAVEIGKLALSDSLATRIAHVFRIDKDWLLKNDLGAPLPEMYSPFGPVASGQHQEGIEQTIILCELFTRLVNVLAGMKKGQNRTLAEAYVAIELDNLKKGKRKSVRIFHPGALAERDTVEFFIQNPGQLHPSLREWVNLKGLLESSAPRPVLSARQSRRIGRPPKPSSAPEPVATSKAEPLIAVVTATVEPTHKRPQRKRKEAVT